MCIRDRFEAAGLVTKHNFEGGHALYELDRGDHHYHMVDMSSGQIAEFESPEIVSLVNRIADEHGYVLDEHSLVLYVRRKR
jgi:Fur family ferric uptake transcriptional regulator